MLPGTIASIAGTQYMIFEAVMRLQSEGMQGLLHRGIATSEPSLDSFIPSIGRDRGPEFFEFGMLLVVGARDRLLGSLLGTLLLCIVTTSWSWLAWPWIAAWWSPPNWRGSVSWGWGNGSELRWKQHSGDCSLIAHAAGQNLGQFWGCDAKQGCRWCFARTLKDEGCS